VAELNVFIHSIRSARWRQIFALVIRSVSEITTVYKRQPVDQLSSIEGGLQGLYILLRKDADTLLKVRHTGYCKFSRWVSLVFFVLVSCIDLFFEHLVCSCASRSSARGFAICMLVKACIIACSPEVCKTIMNNHYMIEE
jgi:hypothetical protein